MKKAAGVAFAMWLASLAGASAEIQYTGRALRDPFREVMETGVRENPSQDEEFVKSMAVEGVMLSPKGNRAIINGKIYKEGAAVGNGKIMRIESKSVVVTVNGKEVVLKQIRRKISNEPALAPTIES